MCDSIDMQNTEPLTIDDKNVTALFRRVNPNKGPGPDGLHTGF